MNAVKQLLAQLQAHHIELWESDGALRFRAPEGAFTPALREQVRAQKTAILAALRAQQHLRHDPDQRYAPFPLTAVQSAYLLGRTRAWQDGGTGCHGYAELIISEPEPRTADEYQQAWQKMVACHDMLKVRASPEGWQCIDPQVAVPLAITVATSAAQHDKAQQVIRQRLKHQQYDPQQPPLLTAHLVLGPQGTTLHLSVDLIMTDFVGINVMVTDFLQALRQPEQALQPPTLSFRDYVLHIRQQQESAAGLRTTGSSR
ncbi:hypothetical protein F9C28_01625 [Shimwellia pseudoproteus]|nr:hypothetical protein [Shimwellia pseudoproteus]